MSLHISPAKERSEADPDIYISSSKTQTIFLVFTLFCNQESGHVLEKREDQHDSASHNYHYQLFSVRREIGLPPPQRPIFHEENPFAGTH